MILMKSLFISEKVVLKGYVKSFILENQSFENLYIFGKTSVV